MAETNLTSDDAFMSLVADLSVAVDGLNEGARALAELLVECERLKAVNAALLAALKSSLNWLASYPGGGADTAYATVRAAIKAAEGSES